MQTSKRTITKYTLKIKLLEESGIAVDIYKYVKNLLWNNVEEKMYNFYFKQVPLHCVY